MDDTEELSRSFDRALLESDEGDDGQQNDMDVDENALLLPANHDVSFSSTISSTNDGSVNSWTSEVVAHDPWTFSSNCGPGNAVYSCLDPMDFYELFLNDQLMSLIVEETNKYGKSKDADFENTDAEEIRKFIGLCLQMGMVKMPRLRDYWSTRAALGGHSIAGKSMSRDRFEELLRSLHFADNNNSNGNRLYKIESFMVLFNSACEHSYCPGKEICIDESLVPFRGRLKFRQYIPSKRHRYGIKLFKLCCKGGYTWRTKIYAGKELTRSEPVSEFVVRTLMDGLLDEGRCLCADNWYSSIRLARDLVNRRTHYIGTLRRNRVGIPKRLKELRLTRGQIFCQQSRDGILVMKWRDKRDLIMISTMHDACTFDGKPKLVIDYNKMMGYVDQSDQMCAYTPYIRKTTKWYIRLFFHLLLQTAMVNAWKLYCDIVKKIKLNDFKMDIIEAILGKEEHSFSTTRHNLLEMRGYKRITRRRCTSCYKQLAKSFGRSYAARNARRINTICSSCHKYFCVDCFQNSHKKCEV